MESEIPKEDLLCILSHLLSLSPTEYSIVSGVITVLAVVTAVLAFGLLALRRYSTVLHTH